MTPKELINLLVPVWIEEFRRPWSREFPRPDYDHNTFRQYVEDRYGIKYYVNIDTQDITCYEIVDEKKYIEFILRWQ